MSKFVKVKTELRDGALICQALDDLKIDYQEDARYVHRWSGREEQVPILVGSRPLAFGLQPDEEGVYAVLADDMVLGRVQKLMQRVQQRYAYHKVLGEVEKAGFALVDESTGEDQVIRLTVRRWS